MSPNLQLYMAAGSCSLAPHILLGVTGLPFSLTKLSPQSGVPEEFRSINPKARVPVLRLDDQIITEAPAIMTAIANLAPEKHLLGKTDLEKVRAYEWFNYLSGTLHGQGFGGLFRPARYIDDERLFDAIRAKGRETITACYSYIEEKLQGVHAVGTDFTAVDAYLLVFYRWGNSNGFGMRENYPKYTALVEEVAKLDATKEVVKEEGIPMFGV